MICLKKLEEEKNPLHFFPRHSQIPFMVKNSNLMKHIHFSRILDTRNKSKDFKSEVAVKIDIHFQWYS